MVDLSLNGRVALVSGGESGIGAACVAALGAAGADVGVIYFQDEKAGEASADAVRKLGRKAIAVQADISLEKDVEAAFDKVAAELGLPTILVNSAGRNMSGVPVSQMSTDQWKSTIDTDLTGTFLMSRRFVQNLKDKPQPAAIINITSIHAVAMRAGGADYDAAKGGQKNLTETLAIEVGPQGITVNAIAPGAILTEGMNAKAVNDPAAREEHASHIPLRRIGHVEEIAGVAVFLASPAGSYMTGSTVTVDGGLSLMRALGA